MHNVKPAEGSPPLYHKLASLKSEYQIEKKKVKINMEEAYH